MTTEQRAFTNALIAWLESQQAHPPDAIVGMITTAGAALGNMAPTLEALADGVGLTQQLILTSAMNAFANKEPTQ